MSELLKHPASMVDETSTEQARLRHRQATRRRRAKRSIVLTVGLVLVAAWFLHLKATDDYRARVTRDVVGVHWILDTVSSGDQTIKAPASPQYWLELTSDGTAGTSSSNGCSVNSSKWSATHDGFDFTGGDDEAIGCGPNGIAPAIDPLIVAGQQALLSGASVTDRIDGARLILSYSPYTLVYHPAG